MKVRDIAQKISQNSAALVELWLEGLLKKATPPNAYLRWNLDANHLEGRVFDIVDAGPLHKFTVLGNNGRAVSHNCLSMQFGASWKSVVAAVRSATKDETIPDEQGKEWVEEYRNAYPDYTSTVDQLRRTYRDGYGIVLPNGWRMGKDNPSALSAGNLPIQGLGSVILQRACVLADEAGLFVIATLHDAITILSDEGKEHEDAETLKACMLQAAKEIIGIEGMKVGAPEFVYHGDLWIHSEKAKTAWNRFSKYFS